MDPSVQQLKPCEREPGGWSRATGWLAASSVIWPLLVAALVALPFLTFPPPPRDIGTDGDVSWGAVLSYAHQHDFQFGTQLRYTYGPLGFLIQLYFSPYASGLRLITDVLVCYCAAAGLCLVAWQLRIWWRVVLPCFLIFTASNLEGRSDLTLEVAFFCWTLLSFSESGSRLRAYLFVFVALAAFASLAKTSFLFISLLCIGALATDLFVRRERRLAVILPVAFLVLVVAGWAATGQRLIHLPVFLLQSLAVVRAYNESMGWEGLSAVSQAGAVLGILSLAIVAGKMQKSFPSEDPHRRARQVIVFFWLGLLTFSIWKHSFLREDARHSPFFMVFAPVIAIGLGMLASRPNTEPSANRRGLAHRILRFWPEGLTVFCCLFSVLVLQWLYFASPKRSLRAPFHSAVQNFKTLVNPEGYVQEMKQATEPWRKEAELPGMNRIVGNGTTDCFGFKQVYLLFNGWSYTPRPVFQSFFACNEQLMGWNEDFYLSTEAPQFVLFSLVGVDRKFPALDDARALRTLLCNYEPVTTEKAFLLLRSKGREAPKLNLLAAGTARAGAPIDLRPYQPGDLWLEIEASPSLAGKVRQFLYRAPMMRLAAYREPGKGLLLRRRAPAAMLAAGFVADPLLSSTADVLNLYAGTNSVHPGAYSIEVMPGTEKNWRPTFRFRIYRIENKLGQALPADWQGESG